MVLYFALSLPLTAFSSFWVMRRQRVRVLAYLCHSSLMVLSSCRPRSEAAAAARPSISASISSFSDLRVSSRESYVAQMRYSSGMRSRSMAASSSSSNLVRCSPSCAWPSTSAYLVHSSPACSPWWQRNASSIRGSLADARYSWHRSARLTRRASSLRTRRSTSGRPLRCWSLSRSLSSASLTRASTTSWRADTSSTRTRGCFSHTFSFLLPMAVLARAMRPKRLKLLLASRREGMTLRARWAAESSRMYRPWSYSPSSNLAWLLSSASSSANAMTAANAPHAPRRSMTSAWRSTLPLLSSLARSASRCLGEKKARGRGVAITPHLDKTSCRRRWSADSAAPEPAAADEEEGSASF
mmetsp:Transcript_28366/g.62360  ORF Transcript_28366/g.62360 Transcript_28366/m.62360 type:complete len:356 (-) Transcript_28366:393-1460(-)